MRQPLLREVARVRIPLKSLQYSDLLLSAGRREAVQAIPEYGASIYSVQVEQTEA